MKRWLPLLALVAVCIASWWVFSELSDPDAEEDATSGDIADFYMETFSTTVMDENGQPKRTLTGERMSYFAKNDTKEVEHPYLIVYHPNRSPWHAKSERAWVSANEDVMLLYGDVLIWRVNEAGVRELEIETRDVRVLPDTQYGETDQPVVIRTPSSETRSIGMRAYMEQRRIELLSGVKTIYEQNAN